MRRIQCLFLLLLFTAGVACGADEPPEHPRILFVHLRINDGVFSVVGTTNAPGVLKARRAPAVSRSYRLVLEDGGGRELWWQSLADPTVRRLEYEDPDNPGALRFKEVRLTDAECVVRMPDVPGPRRLAIYRARGPAESGANDALNREFIARLDLPGAEGLMKTARVLLGMVATLAWSVPHTAGQGVLFPLLSNGPSPNRINLVFLAEAYTSGQTNQFLSDARNLLNRMLGTAPLNAYSNSFNADAIFVASAQSGSDRPSLGVFRNTYFNSSFESYGIAQLLTIPPNNFDASYARGYGKVDALLQALRPDFDYALMVVNDPVYGGSGGTVLVTSTHSSSGEIVTHEFGHTFAGLGDEYSTPYPGYPDVEEPNTTRATNRAAIKWHVWIPDATPLPTPDGPAYDSVVGLFEGAHYHDTGWYRPKRNCRMRSLGAPFCEVCGETLVKSVYGLVSPVDGFSPSSNAVIRLTNSASVTLAIAPVQPTDHSLSVQWFVNDALLEVATNDTLTVAGWDLPAGTNRVRAVVSDSTALVRTDPPGLLQDSVTWRVASATARPRLFLQRVTDQLVLSWSSNAVGFALESTAMAGTTNAWQRLGIITNDGPLTLTATNETQFLRLGQP